MTTFPVALPGAQAPTLMWSDPATVDPAALDQLRNISRLPWVHGVRVMPDVHLGKGATVGSVIAMRDAVSPAAVGVDIGCGMTGVRTSLTAHDLPDNLRGLRSAIEAVVPVGWSSHDGSAPVLGRELTLGAAFDRLFRRFGELRAPGVADREGRAAAQCGSLGGGNHFVEVCTDETGRVWLMLHSGSRNIGKELAERHVATAKTLDHNIGLPDRDLAVFLAGTDEMTAYLHDLYWAQDYAALNREIMMASIREVVREHFPHVRFDEPVRCHHNYVAEESYDGVDVVVTRKGAIRAGTGDLGLIPGSMGTGSYVVRGLGNEASYCSASHGAGRRMSRNAAKRRFTVDDLRAQTAGVECRKDAGVIDEIPAAYKDLESVIAAQAQGPSPLVEVVNHLTTVLCVKG
jgi:tRNA-splicing ligase RtcB